jgi:peptidoglycan/LPS O-acetylase OafA/YrhL
VIWKTLGLIRGVLALIVACGHLVWFLDSTTYPALLGLHFSPQVAVLGFLAISGFSIAASFFRQPEKYYLRRVVRIVPLYLFCVIVSAFLPMLHGGSIQNSRDTFTTPDACTMVGNLLLLQGFAVKYINTDSVVWTLSIEVFFYVITPLLAKLHSNWIALAGIVSCAAYAGWRFLNLPFFADMRYGMAVVFMGWPWLMGFWIYRVKMSKDALLAAVIVGIGVIAFNGSFLGWLWPLTWCLTIAGICWGGLISSGSHALNTLFQTVGDISYPLYLIHMPCFIFLQTSPIPRSPVLWILIAILASFLLDRVYDRAVKALLRKAWHLDKAS